MLNHGMAPSLHVLPEWSHVWAERRLLQHTASNLEVSDKEWMGLRDWLCALPIERPKMVGKLHKLTLFQALDAASKWHVNMAARAERTAMERGSFGGDADAVEVIGAGDAGGWRWVRIITPEGLDYEGAAMGHCVGRGGYDEGTTIVSLRDKDNMPHCTIQWDEKTRTVEQVQGRGNSPVVEAYHSAILAFINALEPARILGAGYFGCVLVEGKLLHWSKLPSSLHVAGYFNLSGCTGLTHLPDGLQVGGGLYLRDCTGLTHLPDGLQVAGNLDLRGCTGLTHLPDALQVGGNLDLRGCTSLTHLPDGLQVGGGLSLRDCTGLTHLPHGLQVVFT
jgi:hypothetical protein